MSIEVWAARLERELTESETALMLDLLPVERRERLLRVKQRERWREPLCAYLILFHALREQYSWRELPPMAYSSLGKPYFPDFPEVHFNLSHTRGAVLIGLSDEPVGVDIERIRPVGQKVMRRLANAKSERDFFRSWVRREARTKRTGEGIGTMLESETPMQPGEHFYEMETFPGYVAGIATRSSAIPGAVRKYQLEDML